MICLVENKFKHVLYKKHINKHEELNQEFNQQVQNAMQLKTQLLRIYFIANYINFYILFDSTN